MYRRVIIISIALLAIPVSGFAQSPAKNDSLSAIAAPAPVDSAADHSVGMLMLLADRRFHSGLVIPLYSRPEIDMHRLLGYRICRASTYEMALQGAGTGMTMGAMAGAFGMMTGALDEREAWYVAGAAAAVGAIMGTARSDDPEWNIRIRWDPDK